MAQLAAASGAPYQTYARPLAGEKRKRASTSNQSQSIQHDKTSPTARSKKRRPNEDMYNHKYNAEMCFSAYKERLHKAGFGQYTRDVANDWRQDLAEVFRHAASKGTIKQDAAARHVIPRLVVLVPRSNEKKDEIVKDFAKHYDNVRCDMAAINKFIDNGCQVDDDSIADVRECLYGLHSALDKGGRWRSIIPYTPLPLPPPRLQVLHDLIEYSQPYHFLRDLLTNIEDIVDWLSPPRVSIDFLAGLKDEAMEALQQATEDKIVKTSIGPDSQQMAEYREKKAEQQRLEKEEQARQQERANLERVQKLEAEQEQMKQKIKSLELAATKQREEESARKRSEAAALEEREKSYQNQIAHNTAEIGKLSTDLTILAGGQVQKTKPEVTSTPSVPTDSRQLNTSMSSSFSSNQTANSSFCQPQSSLGTSFGSSMGGSVYGQLGCFGQTSHQPLPDDNDVPMSDVHGVSSTDFSDSGTHISGQSNPFVAHIGSGVPPQLLGLSAGNFKPACPAYKNGSCVAGRGCKLPHTACKFWLNGNCRFGGKCNRSHDPFFLEEAASRGQLQQSSRADQMVIDSDPAPRSNVFSQVNPFQRTGLLSSLTGGTKSLAERTSRNGQPTVQHEQQNRTHDSRPSNSMNIFGRQAPPTGPRERASITSRITKDGQPTLGRNAFLDRITKNDQPISSQGSVSVSTDRSNAFGQQSMLDDVSQVPRTKAASEKVACRNNFKGRCNKGEACQYAHQPCPHFLNGTCRFGDDRCRMSHDPAFLDLDQASSNGGQRSLQSLVQHQPPQLHNMQSLDDIIQARGGRKEKHGKQPQPQPSARHQHPQTHLEQSLDDMIQTAGRGRKENQGEPTQSKTLCRWQKTPNGCTNNSCSYQHGPPKDSNSKAPRSARSLEMPNLWGSVASILRGNR